VSSEGGAKHVRSASHPTMASLVHKHDIEQRSYGGRRWAANRSRTASLVRSGAKSGLKLLGRLAANVFQVYGEVSSNGPTLHTDCFGALTVKVAVLSLWVGGTRPRQTGQVLTRARLLRCIGIFVYTCMCVCVEQPKKGQLCLQSLWKNSSLAANCFKSCSSPKNVCVLNAICFRPIVTFSRLETR
jgi:hypothetical protein